MTKRLRQYIEDDASDQRFAFRDRIIALAKGEGVELTEAERSLLLSESYTSPRGGVGGLVCLAIALFAVLLVIDRIDGRLEKLERAHASVAETNKAPATTP